VRGTVYPLSIVVHPWWWRNIVESAELKAQSFSKATAAPVLSNLPRTL
jgi:hypothetical protein